MKLILENGKVFQGSNFGSNKKQIGELFFATSMVGYQDILSDPSYFGKIVCMSYPLIGNYGLSDDDYEAKNIHIRGYVVKENNNLPSNFRSTRILSDAMEENNVTGIEGIDTRELVKYLRDNGLTKAMITNEEDNLEECLKELKEYQEIKHQVSKVSCKKVWYSRTSNPIKSIVIVDLGLKTSLVKQLNKYGINVTVVPYNYTLDQIRKYNPNGIIISHGPGNPNNYPDITSLIKNLKGKYPLLGLGLGAELIALTYDCEVTKMTHGHQGSNFPIRNVNTDKIEICSQNHFYSIKLNPQANLKLTHENVLDKDVEGFIDQENKIIAIHYLIQETLNENEDVINNFIKLMK
jgi:carbamoyl-phosphate synthase small subunit